MQIVLRETSKPILWEKNIVNLAAVELAQRVVKVTWERLDVM